MPKIIRVKFRGDTVTIEPEGFAGEECQKATAALERRLGVKTNDEPTFEAQLDPLALDVEPGLTN